MSCVRGARKSLNGLDRVAAIRQLIVAGKLQTASYQSYPCSCGVLASEAVGDVVFVPACRSESLCTLDRLYTLLIVDAFRACLHRQDRACCVGSASASDSAAARILTERLCLCGFFLPRSISMSGAASTDQYHADLHLTSSNYGHSVGSSSLARLFMEVSAADHLY